MELQLADKVNYKGGNVCFGFVGDTDQFDVHTLKPTNGTYIWHIIHHPNDGNFYIIQHVDGKTKDFFEKQNRFFGGIDFSKLKDGNKYIIVPAQDLESAEPKKEPIPIIEEPNVYEDSGTIPLSEEIQEIEPIEEVEEEMDELPEELSQEVREIEQEIELGLPYLTPETCPLSTMIQIAPKAMLMFSRKMVEPFSIQTPSGARAVGRGGDYVIRTQRDHLFIHPKETFDLMYEDRFEMPTKQIGKDKKVYRIEQDVYDYIAFLESENEEFRRKLYLQNNQ